MSLSFSIRLELYCLLRFPSSEIKFITKAISRLSGSLTDNGR
uniref:Uncharacterized protein n=1 Tax=Cucumis melo TaxID=3656 RepID=A0A9I9E9J9_CUCME